MPNSTRMLLQHRSSLDIGSSDCSGLTACSILFNGYALLNLVKVRDNEYVEAVLNELGKVDASEPGYLVVMAQKALLAGATMGEINAALAGEAKGETIEAILAHRWTERYEELRLRTEKFQAETGENVKIF